MGSILRLQDGLSDLKNLDFASDIHRILKYRLSIFQNGLDSVLDISWASFASFWGSPGRPLGALEVSWATLGGSRTPTRPINGDQERFLTFLMLFYSRLIFFSVLDVAFYLLLTPLGVDFAATRWHFRPQKP